MRHSNHERVMAVMAVITTLCLVFLPVSSEGTWLDSLYGQYTKRGPSSYQGQERGYWTAGSFSARIPVQMVHPFTATAPRLSMGCGGIDFFGGSFSYMSMDKLVKLLQSILSSAAGVSFDLALKVLCPQCSETIKAMQALAAQINSGALDSCKAAKTIVSWGANEVSSTVLDQQQQESLAKWQAQNSIYNTYSDFQNYVEGVNGKASAVWSAITGGASGSDDTSTPPLSIKACPNGIQQIFGTPGSLLENIRQAAILTGVSVTSYNGAGAMDQDMMALVRGMIGDIQISATEGVFKANPVPPCTDAYSSLSDFLTGNYQTRGPQPNDQCQTAPQGFKSLVSADLKSIATAMQQHGSLSVSGEQFNLISVSSLPIMLILKSAINRGDVDMAVDNLADLTAITMIAGFIENAENMTTLLLRYADAQAKQASTVGPATTGDATQICDMSVLANVVEGARDLRGDLRAWKGANKEGKAKAIAEIKELMELANQYQQLQISVEKSISKSFGSAVAKRAAAKM